MRRVIGFCGLIGSGKSTAADHLVERYGFRKIKFAGALKDMCRALGLSDRELEGDLKEKPCELLGGKSPRWAMQSLGTEWGRDMIVPDLWIRVWRHACAAVPADVGITCDDVRFPNEVDTIRSLNGLVIRVERSSVAATEHISERHTIVPDLAIKNDGGVLALTAAVDYILEPLLKSRALV